MPDPESANLNLLQQAAAALGLFASGLFGTRGYDKLRRRRNGAQTACPIMGNGAEQIVSAIKDEGVSTRKVLYESAKEHTEQLGAVATELAIIKDRLQR